MAEVMDVPIRATVRCYVRPAEHNGLGRGGDREAELVHIPNVIDRS